MTLKIGDKIPNVTLKQSLPDSIIDIATEEFFKGKTIALFSVPGAFTPTCSNIHIVSFLEHCEDLKHKGIDGIACIAVNDPFVMQAWAKVQGAGDKIAMLADYNADFSKAVGLTFDGSGAGLGLRALRYSAIVKDGVIENLHVEKSPGVCEVSNAETILKDLR